MMVLVIGGSGSGKSAYAEELACLLACEEHTAKYYLATMRVLDVEGKQKVERHRQQRSGEGFFTIEQPVRIADALFQMENGRRTVLLECISNLTANEMFTDSQIRAKDEVAKNIIGGIEQLKKNTTHLVVVSNNVFEDGMVYDAATMDYIDAVGKINQALAALSEWVLEIVAGIPVSVKYERGLHEGA